MVAWLRGCVVGSMGCQPRNCTAGSCADADGIVRPHPTFVRCPGALDSLAAFLLILVLMGIWWWGLGAFFRRRRRKTPKSVSQLYRRHSNAAAIMGLSSSSAPGFGPRSRALSYADVIADWDSDADGEEDTLPLGIDAYAESPAFCASPSLESTPPPGVSPSLPYSDYVPPSFSSSLRQQPSSYSSSSTRSTHSEGEGSDGGDGGGGGGGGGVGSE